MIGFEDQILALEAEAQAIKKQIADLDDISTLQGKRARAHTLVREIEKLSKAKRAAALSRSQVTQLDCEGGNEEKSQLIKP